MTRGNSDPDQPPSWLVGWLHEARTHSQRHSLVLGARCCSHIHRISCRVADYLNEFDTEAGSQWRAFDVETIRQLAGHPACRDILLAEPDSEAAAGYSDFDRIQRRLVRLGGVILEGQCGLEATKNIREVFHVCLCTEEPLKHNGSHMWINPDRFSRDGLASMIADSFLNWSGQQDDFASRSRIAFPSRRSADTPSRGPWFSI